MLLLFLFYKFLFFFSDFLEIQRRSFYFFLNFQLGEVFQQKKPLVQKFNLNDDDQKKAARTEVPGQLPALCAAINEGKNRRGAALPGRWGAAPLRVGPQQVGRPGLLRNRKSNQRSPGTDPFVYPSAPRERSKVTQPGRPSGSSSSQRDKQREGSSIPPDQRRDCRQGCSATNQVATKWRPEGHPGRRHNPGSEATLRRSHGFIAAQSAVSKQPSLRSPSGGRETYQVAPSGRTNTTIYFLSENYKFLRPTLNIEESIILSKTYCCHFYIPVQYFTEIQWVFLGTLPLLTRRGHFIINGIPRVILHQIVRSPGIYFHKELQKKSSRLFYAEIISQRGPWVRLEIDKKKKIWISFQVSTKIPLHRFFQNFSQKFIDQNRNLQKLSRYATIGLQHEVQQSLPISEQPLAKAALGSCAPTGWNRAAIPPLPGSGVSSPSGNIPPNCHESFRVKQNTEKRTSYLKRLQKKFQQYNSFYSHGYFPYIIGKNNRSEMSSIRIDFDLGIEGRLRLNKRLGLSLKTLTLTPIDFLAISNILSQLDTSNIVSTDDIDDLKNRRLKTIGELLQNQFDRGLDRVQKTFERKSFSFNLLKNLEHSRPTLQYKKEEQKNMRNGRFAAGRALGAARRWNGSQKVPPKGIAARVAPQPTRSPQSGDQKVTLVGSSYVATLAAPNATEVKCCNPSLRWSAAPPSQPSLREEPGGLRSSPGSQSLPGSGVSIPKVSKKKVTTFMNRINNPLMSQKQLQFLLTKLQFKRASLWNVKLKQQYLSMTFNTQFSIPINSTLKEFFHSHQLSQYLDQSNPLAEITHKRRLSCLGSGGVNRETAGMEIRGIHQSHYGRICPIETPEGKNAGLVNSLTTNVHLNNKGFLETPYLEIYKQHSQNQRPMLIFSAEDQETKNVFLSQKLPKLRAAPKGQPTNISVGISQTQNFQKCLLNSIHLVAFNPQQFLSIATTCIPFIEHDDANRALMGSNMQRQALPLISLEPPFVTTFNSFRILSDLKDIPTNSDTGLVTYVSQQKISIYQRKNIYKIKEKKISRRAPMGLLHFVAFISGFTPPRSGWGTALGCCGIPTPCGHSNAVQPPEPFEQQQQKFTKQNISFLKFRKNFD